MHPNRCAVRSKAKANLFSQERIALFKACDLQVPRDLFVARKQTLLVLVSVSFWCPFFSAISSKPTNVDNKSAK